jgi:hypothetical protein
MSRGERGGGSPTKARAPRDSTERGRVLWARVKGETENALLRLPFKAAYMFRPAGIQPLHGIKSKTKLYRAFYAVTGPIFPLLKALFPNYVTTTEHLGRAMIKVARQGLRKRCSKPRTSVRFEVPGRTLPLRAW